MIPVQYSCDDCGVKDALVLVPPREAAEDIEHWIEQVCAVAISIHHAKRSPRCRAISMAHVKIPMPAEEGGRVGDMTKQ